MIQCLMILHNSKGETMNYTKIIYLALILVLCSCGITTKVKNKNTNAQPIQLTKPVLQ